MSDAWRKAHEDRVERYGNYCEVCGQSSYPTRHLIGHHLAGKKFQKANNLEVWQLLELRHPDCEAEMHANFRKGNTPTRQKEVDAIVAELLEKPP